MRSLVSYLTSCRDRVGCMTSCLKCSYRQVVGPTVARLILRLRAAGRSIRRPGPEYVLREKFPMAIDQEIQRKVDAYRSNPQALQQRYAQNQQLIDLLALQKLKSEKDAAAKQMQLQMARTRRLLNRRERGATRPY